MNCGTGRIYAKADRPGFVLFGSRARRFAIIAGPICRGAHHAILFALKPASSSRLGAGGDTPRLAPRHAGIMMNCRCHWRFLRACRHFRGLYSMFRTQFNTTLPGRDGGLALALALSFCAASSRGEDSTLEYNRDIRPILLDNCFACHGPDSAVAAGRSAARSARGGRRAWRRSRRAIPTRSEMIRRILSDDDDGADAAAGDEEEAHATRRKQTARALDSRRGRVSAALVADSAGAARPFPRLAIRWWVRNPIDSFVAARLEAAGLTPAPEADRRTLARRLSLDLTGLPPAPELVEEFVNDTVAGRLRAAGRQAAGVAASGASIAAATGSTRPATPTRTASTSTTTARCGRTAIG